MINKKSIIYYAKVALIFLPCLIWDVTLWTITWLYQKAEKFDKVGGQWIDNFLNGD
jgi:hypothetical protein